MFPALLLGVFFIVLLVVVRLQTQRHHRIESQLQSEFEKSRQDLEKEREYSNRLLTLLTTLHDKKVSPTGRIPYRELTQTLAETARNLLHVDRAVLLQWDPTLWELRGLASLGLSPEQFAALHVRRGDGILGKALQSGKVVVAQKGAAPSTLVQESFLVPPYLVIPFVLQDHLGGMLAFSGPAEGGFDSKQIQLATLLADQTQLILENLDLYQSRDLSHQEIVEALVKAKESKDAPPPERRGRIRLIVRAMARELHLPGLLVDQFDYAAALHDLGKIAIPEQLLQKTQALTEGEQAAMHKHPEIGYQILRPLSFLRPVAPMVLYHHEWFNGQGYPEGLAGEEIPLGARMIAIVDAWEAMLTDQPYRPAMARHAAIAELRQQAGTQFDPKLVDVFLRGIDRWEREAVEALPARTPATSASPLIRESR